MNLKFWKKKIRPEEERGDTAETEDDKTMAKEAPDRDVPVTPRPKLSDRIHSGFARIIRRFRKSPPSGDIPEDGHGPDEDRTIVLEAPETDMPPKGKLLQRIKSGCSTLAFRFRKAPPPDSESEPEGDALKKQGSAENRADDTVTIRPMRAKKRLIVGAAIGVLVLLLSGVGFAVWQAVRPATEHDAAAATAKASHGSLTVESPENELDALRKKNHELQTQIEAMKKGGSQESPPDSSDGVADSDANPASSAGEITLSNKDPKAAAQSLKEAIEAMNASSGRSTRTPEK